MDNDQHGCLEPFDIDDGSLNDVSPQLIFSLGVEWEMWRTKILNGTAATGICLGLNASRIVKMLERHNYFCEDRQYPIVENAAGIGASSSEWRHIWVGDLKYD